jgi:hypothetical protein
MLFQLLWYIALVAFLVNCDNENDSKNNETSEILAGEPIGGTGTIYSMRLWRQYHVMTTLLLEFIILSKIFQRRISI